MKNLHLLVTDKPSRLFVDNDDNKLRLYKVAANHKEYAVNKNIYITDDSEIKEGDWVLYDKKYIRKTDKTFNKQDMDWNVLNTDKIILTTDKDLIVDGVQAIDDTFLEWFVKNPSCEWADVNDWLDDSGNIAFGGTKRYQICNHLYNKVIIPQEEPKQETLEEAAESWLKSKTLLKTSQAPGLLIGFIEGAKWQAERMYSEEEVRQMLWELGDALFNNCQEGIEEGEPETYFDIIINEFKKTKDGK
jgi:hypothetical protein